MSAAADDGPILVHASAVALGGRGVLVRGPSGSGKSALALALTRRGTPARPAALVSDDQVFVRREAGSLRLHTPDAIAGLLEIRGVGLVRVPFETAVPLALVVDLAPRASIERMPAAEANRVLLLGETVRRIRLPERDPAFAADVIDTLLGCGSWPVVKD